MAFLTPTAVNELNNVYEIATTDRVLGGELGVVNRQAQSLLNTCKYLDNRITTNTTNIAQHTNQINDLYTKIIPVGTIIMVAHNGAMPGYLLCDGSRISRTTYSALFAVIGTTYGSGIVGENNFNIPYFTLRYPRGVNSINSNSTYFNAGLPNITGHVVSTGSDDGPLPTRVSAHGAFGAWRSTGDNGAGGGNEYGAYNFDFNASRSNPIYGRDTTVVPESVGVKFFIKY